MAVAAKWDRVTIRNDHGRETSAVAPVIISASRSTDIPAFYAQWFMNGLRRGYVTWINPFNRKPSHVAFEKTRAVVFWSKNPKPMLPFLDELDNRGINYYFQFTVNKYEAERLEPNVPVLPERLDTFRKLSERLGPQRVIWRFDPLLLTDTVGIRELLTKVRDVGEQIHSYTRKLVFSFADIGAYKKVQANLRRAGVQHREFTPNLMHQLAAGIKTIADEWGLEVATCAEPINLSEFGISHNRCIDDRLMVALFRHDRLLMDFLGVGDSLPGLSVSPDLKDKGQREACGCIVSKDIGMYDTCPHLCTYCYANASPQAVKKNICRHRVDCPAIIPLST